MCQLQASDFVICIDNTPVHRQSRTMPELGQLYTVEAVRQVNGGYGIRLVELTPDCYKGGPCACGECGWDSARFRKVYRPDDGKLAVFRKIVDTPVRV